MEGMEYWAKVYNDSIQDPLELKKKADKYMEQYDKQKAEEEAKRKKMASAVPDADGWVTVVPKSAKAKNIDQDKKIIKKLEKKRKEREEEASKVPFPYQYKFNSNHKKFENLSKLRQQFELDKQKLAQAKANRKFKPY